MVLFKKYYFKKAFKWGKREHNLEKLTDKLLLVDVCLAVFTFATLSLLFLIVLLFMVGLTLIVHLVARWCHRKEKKYHSKARH